MKTATAVRSVIEQADWADISRALRPQYQIWHAGLSREQFLQSFRLQMQTTWGRRHLAFYVLKDAGAVVASCKLYDFEFRSRGRDYRVAGVGAVFTHLEHRGKGHASMLMDGMIDLASMRGYDAMLLHSDIDESFYEQFSFVPLSNHEFYVCTNDPQFERQILCDNSFAEDLHEHVPDVALLESEHIPLMVSQYARHLASIPFGRARDEYYMEFKLVREQFIQMNSSWNRPPLELMTIDASSKEAGYALFEQDGKYMRVLEVIGPPATKDILWRDLLRSAYLRRVQIISGWEAAAPQSLPGMRHVSRDRARLMLLPLNEACESWLDAVPCQLLELDHF